MFYKTITITVLALILSTSFAWAVQPGWLEDFSIAQPVHQKTIEGGVPVSALPKLYSGYGGVVVGETKEYEKVEVTVQEGDRKGHILTIIRPKGTDYHN